MPTRRLPRARRAWWWSVTGGAVVVIERSGAGAEGDGAEGPLVDRVIEAAVAYVAGQHGAFLARRDGQG